MMKRVFVLIALTAGLAQAQQLPDDRQSLADAWWTGPLLANSPATLPRGHVLVEPYLYDVIGSGYHAFGSSAYIEYGLVDRFTVGMIPVIGYNRINNGISSSGLKAGDMSLLAQYRLTQFHEHSRVPATGLMVQQTFPTAKYDRLGRLSDGLGGGAYKTTVSLNSQTYFWMPNERILRMRLDVSESFSRGADVRDMSVYGTANGFRGHTNPANSLLIDAASEYSATQRWVPALDVIYQRRGNTTVTGMQNSLPLSIESGASRSFGFAPAIEYNWSPRVGVIVGARVILPGRNTQRTVAPVMAINYVR